MEAASSSFLRSSVRSTTSPSICSRAPINLTDCILWLFRQFLIYCTLRLKQINKIVTSWKKHSHKLKKVKLYHRKQQEWKNKQTKKPNKQKESTVLSQGILCSGLSTLAASATHLFKVILSQPIKFKRVDSTTTVQVYQGVEYTYNLTHFPLCTMIYLAKKKQKTKKKKIGKICYIIQ